MNILIFHHVDWVHVGISLRAWYFLDTSSTTHGWFAPTSTLHVDLWIRQHLEVSTLRFRFAFAFDVATGYASAYAGHCETSILNRGDTCLPLRHEFLAHRTIENDQTAKRLLKVNIHRAIYYYKRTHGYFAA